MYVFLEAAVGAGAAGHDAGRVAQCLPEILRGLSVDLIACHHRNRLRRLDQRCIGFRTGGAVVCHIAFDRPPAGLPWQRRRQRGTVLGRRRSGPCRTSRRACRGGSRRPRWRGLCCPRRGSRSRRRFLRRHDLPDRRRWSLGFGHGRLLLLRRPDVNRSQRTPRARICRFARAFARLLRRRCRRAWCGGGRWRFGRCIFHGRRWRTRRGGRIIGHRLRQCRTTQQQYRHDAQHPNSVRLRAPRDSTLTPEDRPRHDPCPK